MKLAVKQPTKNKFQRGDAQGIKNGKHVVKVRVERNKPPGYYKDVLTPDYLAEQKAFAKAYFKSLSASAS